MFLQSRVRCVSQITQRIRAYSSTGASNYYDSLEVPVNASIKDIKISFRKLSKIHHPDVNTHLVGEEKEVNNEKFVEIVNAYETLKDVKKKKQYDLQLKLVGNFHGANATSHTSSAREDWNNQYYGEAKYYSRSGGHYTASGLNSKRHKVYNFSNHGEGSHFSGKHINYGDRFDVPHFDYNEHLHKHLKFEQHIINKHISPEERSKILEKLSKSGEKLSEELITKHLMRHVHHFKGNEVNPNHFASSTATFAPQATASMSSKRNPHMYHGPRVDDNDSGTFKTFMILGAGGSLFLLYKALF
ncbi:predicted protein [Scheffersomyces stipitis CBS 6054]|uniref:J domain-containing protein n=1 Tax=Scheffersomyces stipitis (strain ATCC 58785 / CBS 6054 / NBRC 10063 / NRRL Y-11545) TaxID=322104 RepID=A3LY36_PICST|nr:predicted protein [Scheffersomyces stipitis CBS 6054]ABN67909.2 predicted protein [Scheffersomyces stipitis CBS 6054]KAG2732072.1 hypothetical protein G9P44_004489 [Scheffersomyces stipitis]